MSGACREAHLPTQHPTACPQARVPRPDAHPRRSVHHQGSPAEGPQPAVGLSVGGISERRAFERLARDGLHARSETLWCRYVPDPARRPATAGVLDRAQRRHRRWPATACAAGCGQRSGRWPVSPPLASGLLLIGARPAALEQSFDRLGRRGRRDAEHLRARPRRRRPEEPPNDCRTPVPSRAEADAAGPGGGLVPAGDGGAPFAVSLHPVVLELRARSADGARHPARAVAHGSPARPLPPVRPVRLRPRPRPAFPTRDR